jgi:hypothetical protein
MFQIRFKGLMTLVLSVFLLFSCSKSEIENENLNFDLKPEISEKAIPIPGQYIVVFNSEITGDIGKNITDYPTSQKAVEDYASALFAEKSMESPEMIRVFSKSITGVTVNLTDNQLEKLTNDKRVAYIEQDRIFTFAPPCGTPNGGPCPPPDDGGGGDGGNGGSTQETPYGITRVNGVSNYTGTNLAWIIDTGIDLTHEDLNVDASKGFNAFTTGQDGNSLNDLNGHGSHVAGTVAAINNNVGVIGVAPGATVIPVKVLDRRGSGSYSGVIAGVDHVGANASSGDVANMSLGGPVSQALDDAVLAASNKGIWFSIAAGNSSANANNYSPARVNGPYIVTVSAMDINDNWASFSNFANPPIDYCAPGVSVKSTWRNGGYHTISGTSMAAPHAAGVLLLGSPSTDGTVNNDPDGNPDPIIVH